MDQAVIFKCCDGLWELEIKQKIGLREWLSFCLTIDLEKNHWKLAKNGEIVEGYADITTNAPVRIRPGGSLFFGQDQDSVGAFFSEFQSLSGLLMDVKIYDMFFTSQQIIKFTMCENFINVYPPIVDFSNINEDFSVSNVDIGVITGGYCNKARDFDLIFPELRVFEDGELLCHIVGGELKVPVDDMDNMRLFNKSLVYAEHCGEGTSETLWLGVKGNVATQKWYHYRNNTPINYSKFDKDNGLPIVHPDTCLVFTGSKETTPELYSTWVSYDCEQEMCTVCHFQQVRLLKMRGLCQQSQFDRDYFVTHDQSSLSFTGVYYSEITKHKPNLTVSLSDFGYWILTRLDKPHITAILHMESPSHYPLGLNNWVVDNDVCGEMEITLLITSCEDRKFSCFEGTCIDLELRCDMEADCPDGSDEINCDFLQLPKEYDKLNPPSRIERGEPIKVHLHITMLSMRHIDLSNFKFTCEIELQLHWIDKRLEFHHLNLAETLNIIDDMSNMPWVPLFEILGDGDTTSDIVTRREHLRVRRFSNPLLDNDENLYEDEIFEGKHNPLVLVKKLTVTTSCDFDLEAFPFDTQTCRMGQGIVLCLQSVHDISIKDVLQYELSPVPPSLFEDNGDMRTAKSKATLKKRYYPKSIEDAMRMSRAGKKCKLAPSADPKHTTTPSESCADS
ncbi:uncharacterized protein LOC121859852 [Homarus americanus]|uniref:uncharacterized protein LOC121859852 n=1 Tax=Homarus americanus TaxID=6706 RepID=UPI001C48CDB4|nr:uncharacterized protein LOC121859852 [Homarus americanus]